jgi:valyl-tRNA synthetase
MLAMSDGYDPQVIEAAWQRRWRDEGTYEVDNDDPRPHYYVLSMYPYPSGSAHMGHVRNYTFGDLIVRYRTMTGHAVLSPMGFDSFGLPCEPERRHAVDEPEVDGLGRATLVVRDLGERCVEHFRGRRAMDVLAARERAGEA